MKTRPVNAPVIPRDFFNRELSVGDYVISYNNLYEVKGLPEYQNRRGMVYVMLVNKSKSTKPLWRAARDTCIVSKEDVMIWMLTKNYER